MPIITFQPSGKTIEVASGTELLDAARKAGVEINSPCGGEGTCGDCVVRIITGKVDSDSPGLLPSKAVDDGFVLACKTRILDESVLIDVPEQIGGKEGKFLNEHENKSLVPQKLLPQNWQLEPLTIKWSINVPEPQLEDGLSDLDRVTRHIQQDFGKKEVIYPFPIIRALADILRTDDGKLNLMLIHENDRINVLGIEPGNRAIDQYGIAIDIGTTTVAVQLVYLPQAKIVETKTDYNAQIECGLDVISRINYARNPDRRKELRNRVLQTINELIQSVTKSHDVEPNQIYNGVISGNTTMIHLLLGLNPEYIRLSPYTPTILEAPYLTAAEVGIKINPLSWIYFSPAVGSYVGGDITSGLLCTDLATDTDEVNLFIDIGTNGEAVVGNRDFLMTCACSAGPAFEGGGIECGMRAASGAIESVEVNRETGLASFQTIGKIKPTGICGTGMISLIAELFITGWIDSAGKLTRTQKSPAIKIDGRRARYIIVPANKSGTGKDIYVSETDIDNVIRAKAAIYSACSLMLNQVGLGFEDLANIYIAGAFGNFLDIEMAITIGLVPDLPREKYFYIGNSSLMGAYMVLVSREFLQRQLELARRMTYLELNTDPTYMDQFTGALFLPHTDLKRFPSVKGGNEKTLDTESALPKESAHQDAIRQAVSKLTDVNLAKRCVSLGLAIPDNNGEIHIRVFGTDASLRQTDFQLIIAKTKKPAKTTDQILVLHYLLCDLPIEANGELISFREIPSGQFYWNSFLSRTVKPLIDKFGNNLKLLQESLNRFDWEEVTMGDFSARIHTLGNLYLTLVFYKGDEELPPEINLLFDSCITRVYNAEDAAVLASRICLGLL